MNTRSGLTDDDLEQGRAIVGLAELHGLVGQDLAARRLEILLEVVARVDACGRILVDDRRGLADVLEREGRRMGDLVVDQRDRVDQVGRRVLQLVGLRGRIDHQHLAPGRERRDRERDRRVGGQRHRDAVQVDQAVEREHALIRLALAVLEQHLDLAAAHAALGVDAIDHELDALLLLDADRRGRSGERQDRADHDLLGRRHLRRSRKRKPEPELCENPFE